MSQNGKGDRQRSVDKKKFDDNWDKIFKNKDIKENKDEDVRNTKDRTKT